MTKHLKLSDHFKFTPGAYAKRCKHLAKLLSHEVRQQILDDWNGGKNLGEISDAHSVAIEVVAAVLEMNTVKHRYTTTRKESL